MCYIYLWIAFLQKLFDALAAFMSQRDKLTGFAFAWKVCLAWELRGLYLSQRVQGACFKCCYHILYCYSLHLKFKISSVRSNNPSTLGRQQASQFNTQHLFSADHVNKAPKENYMYQSTLIFHTALTQ